MPSRYCFSKKQRPTQANQDIVQCRDWIQIADAFLGSGQDPEQGSKKINAQSKNHKRFQEVVPKAFPQARPRTDLRSAIEPRLDEDVTTGSKND